MSRTKKIGIGAVAAVVLLFGGVAYALWSANGSGSGSARAITAQDITLTVPAVAGTADLYPGGPAGDLYFDADNDNPYDVLFDTYAIGTITSDDEVNCPAATNVTAVASGVTSVPVPTGGVDSLVITDVISLDEDAPDGCQGVSFDVELTLTGDQVATP